VVDFGKMVIADTWVCFFSGVPRGAFALLFRSPLSVCGWQALGQTEPWVRGRFAEAKHRHPPTHVGCQKGRLLGWPSSAGYLWLPRLCRPLVLRVLSSSLPLSLLLSGHC